ncbi:hypothetical protein [Methylobacterium sp. Leaf118]|uniref:hypothetical protein n=1 Tax=Methylobacterium sp. Leaf118 TaxID=2876562 RepID=UPI001E32769C|nr:hypothetical protein [Methylobacterium sp. Leaf118]
MSRDPTPGHYYAGRNGTGLLRFSLPSSLPIPLGITAPTGVSLASWAFAGLEEEARGGPVCLLALDGIPDGPVTLATHFRDLAIHPEPARPDALDEAERRLLARALLSAGPAGLPALAGLFPLIEAALSSLPIAEDAHALSPGGPGYMLTGTLVPHALLLYAESGWSGARVATARLGFAGGARIGLGLDAPLWGTRPARVRAAIALNTHGFTPLVVGAA